MALCYPEDNILVFSIKVNDLAAPPPEGEYFRYGFSYENVGYELILSRSLDGQESFYLQSSGINSAWYFPLPVTRRRAKKPGTNVRSAFGKTPRARIVPVLGSTRLSTKSTMPR